MKNIVIGLFVVGVVAIIALAGLGFAKPQGGGSNADFLRLHVRANSNTVTDQTVKHLVRQSIVDELTPLLYDVTTKKDAMTRLAANLDRIIHVANKTLAEAGHNYTARAAIKSEHFPTRSYTNSEANLTLPEGLYDALILELGEGAGDNWWCVVYPPLCFLENNIGGKQGIQYKMKILEWLKK